MTSFAQERTIAMEDELLRRMVEQTLIPSPNVSTLAPTPLLDFVNRMELGVVHPAESFHVNSKLSERHRDDLIEAGRADTVRKWFSENCGHVRPEDLDEELGKAVALHHVDLPPRLGKALSAFGSQGPMKTLLFSADLMVVYNGGAYRQVGGEDQLWKEHTIAAADLERFMASPMGVDPDKFESAVAIAVLVGVPWRNMMFNGPRGYRRMLVDTGMILSAFGSVCQQVGYEVTPAFDFVDIDVDVALANDGVERSALLLVALNEIAEPDQADPTKNGETP